jgi:hypothetical protein
MAQSGHTETICYLSAFGAKRTHATAAAWPTLSLIDPKADMGSPEIPQCSGHMCELLFLIFVLGWNLLLLLNDWPLWLKRMGQRRTALRIIVRQSLPNLRHL